MHALLDPLDVDARVVQAKYPACVADGCSSSLMRSSIRVSKRCCCSMQIRCRCATPPKYFAGRSIWKRAHCAAQPAAWQIRSALKGRHGLDAVHVVAHGASGRVCLRGVIAATSLSTGVSMRARLSCFL